MVGFDGGGWGCGGSLQCLKRRGEEGGAKRVGG